MALRITLILIIVSQTFAQKLMTKDAPRPNIIFILTDDQDQVLNGMVRCLRFRYYILFTIFRSMFSKTDLPVVQKISTLPQPLLSMWTRHDFRKILRFLQQKVCEFAYYEHPSFFSVMVKPP